MINDKGLKEIVFKSGIYFFIRIFAFLFSYIFTIIITRNLGAESYGYITLSFSIMMILSVVCRLGFDLNLTRIFARDNNKVNQGLYTHSVILSLIIGTFFCLLIYLNSQYISTNIFGKPKFSKFLEWTSLTIPLWSIILINSGVFRGLKKNLYYALFNSFGRFFLTTLILIVLLYIFEMNFDHIPAIAHFLGILILSLLSFFLIYQLFGALNFKRKTGFIGFFKVSLPMFLSTSLIIMLAWTDKLFLGYFVSGTEIGVYDISLRIAALIGFTLEALNSILVPKISEAFAREDFTKMQTEITFSAKINFYLSLGVFIFILVFSELILSLFGEEFILGQLVLSICCLGHLINSFSGPVGNILQMTGYHKLFTKIMLVAFIINLILNPVLISLYSIKGAAIAFVISMIFWNFTSSYFVYKKLKIRSFYLPFIN